MMSFSSVPPRPHDLPKATTVMDDTLIFGGLSTGTPVLDNEELFEVVERANRATRTMK